ncbi:sigma-70 family RNA polymerase sigma factor [Sporosarcina gallistercoris]|uniref:Sigma-70 family RNA polymerase sigma factor n=1 Tax=Sporosarcina gallistercoris TaxID=2762245 RepID=A0ABR8PHP0_9BACL|nr:sigma-70 family RNA polymerase sigma factor [Sporosarcina gallistercoris]MBD7907688.1 sigma-70 family RNA polymerase sigma factor [Sporosarcina gallistercoris]
MEIQERDRLLTEAMDIHGDYLLRVVYAIVKERAKAEDIVQEVFIQYYIHIDKFEHRSSVKTYLYRIAINQCHNLFKSWHYRKLELSHQVVQILVSFQNTEEQVIHEESSEELKRLIERLPLKYKEVIWLYYYAELTVLEVGDVLGCSVNTVKTRLTRGRRLLKGILKEENGG